MTRAGGADQVCRPPLQSRSADLRSSVFPHLIRESGGSRNFRRSADGLCRLGLHFWTLRNGVCIFGLCKMDAASLGSVCIFGVCKLGVCKSGVCRSGLCRSGVCRLEVCKSGVFKSVGCQVDSKGREVGASAWVRMSVGICCGHVLWVGVLLGFHVWRRVDGIYVQRWASSWWWS